MDINTIKDISIIIGTFVSLSAFIGILGKIATKRIKNLFQQEMADLKKQAETIELLTYQPQELHNRLDKLEETNKQAHSDAIKSIFYRYKDVDSMPLYEKKGALKHFRIYKDQYNGNSYVEYMIEEIKKKKEIPEAH